MLIVVISIVLLLLAVSLLAIRILFVKEGKFPNTHIGGSEDLRKKNIGCATSQDREAQKDSRRLSSAEIVKNQSK